MSRSQEELDAFWIPLLTRVKQAAKSNKHLRVLLGFNEMSGVDFHQIPTLFPYVETVGIASWGQEAAVQANAMFRNAELQMHEPRWRKVVAVTVNDPNYDGLFDVIFIQE